MNPDPAAADAAGAERLLALVGDALELAPGQRAAFLAGACGGDAALLAEARSLVAHGQEAAGDEFLARPAYALAGVGDGPSEEGTGSLAPGTMLGENRLLSLLGEGGMGEVYLAEDTRLERRVAVKVLKRRLDDASHMRRFRHERKVLAALTHPNIARLYGGGTTPEGRSYLVMEYVAGERLDRFCAQGGLGVGEQLALFRKVCAAVAYAHQNLVVHRDLKPANIRVTPEGEPKLLDFGIAKLLEPEGTTRAELTVTLHGAMTPEYASPEQVKGEAITTASDVYSLGVVLYELLCGRRPYTLGSRRPDELARAICEQDPPRPSAAAGRVSADREPPARLRRQLEGDLDNIVARALRKEPARRYTSVAAFSEDLRRHGEGLPVSARRDTLAYRAGKFVRRHKAGVFAGIVVALALGAELVATIREARRADRRFEDVRRLAHSILFEVEPQMANVPGTIPARSTLVKRALEYLDSLSREAGSRRDLRRELAAAYEKVGAVQGEPNEPSLGDYPGALESYRKALDLRNALVAADPRDPLARHELAACEEHLGETLWWNNQTTEAEQGLCAALALRRRLVAEQPRSVEYRLGLASVLVRLGGVPAWNNRSAEAMTLYREALPILQALARERPQDPEVQIGLARCLADTAGVQKDAGDDPGATANLAAAEAIVAALAAREPNNFTAKNLLRWVLYNESEVLLAQKATDRALELCPRTLGVAESLAASDPENAGCQQNLSASHEVCGEALMQARRWREALASFQAALAIDATLLARSPDNADYQRICGMYHTEMGRARVQLGELAPAEADAQAAQDLLEAAVRLDPDSAMPVQDLVRAYEFRGDLCEQKSETAQARQWFQRAQETIRAHAAMDIAAGDLDDWNALREKLTAKTAPDAASPPLP